MTDKEFRRMSRSDLVEIISQYQNREQELTRQIEELSEQLDDRRTHLDQIGSIAEAALSLNHVFEAAQQAADQYLAEVHAANADMEAQGQKILAAAQAEADALRWKTQEECRIMTETAKQQCDTMFDRITELLERYDELRGLLSKRDN